MSLLCDDHIAADIFVVKGPRKRFMITLSVFLKFCNFHRYAILTAFHELIGDSRMGTTFIRGAGTLVKCLILPFFRAAISGMEMAHLSSLHASIIWFSSKLGSLVWGIGAYTIRAQLTSSSAIKACSIAYLLISRSWIAPPHIF
jgi:hypothetical protein